MQFSHKLETDKIVCTPKLYKEAFTLAKILNRPRFYRLNVLETKHGSKLCSFIYKKKKKKKLKKDKLNPKQEASAHKR